MKILRRSIAKRDAFEKDKAKAVSELHQLGAEGLAAELREHLSLPENAEAAGRVMQEIEETIAPVSYTHLTLPTKA